MTTPCANCGTPINEGAERCPACDALAPLDDDATRVEPAAGGSPAPWTIPIREPDAVALPSDGTPRRSVAFVGLGVIAFLLTVVVAGAALRDDRGSGPDPGEAAAVTDRSATTADTTTTSVTEPSTTETTDTTAATSEADSHDVEVAETTTTTAPPAPQPTVASAQGTGSVPALSSSFGGGWIAQLTSVPRDAGTDALEAAWRQLGADRAIVAARSDDWDGFRKGYWVLVHAGPFASADEVRSHCEAAGRADRNECLPRELVRR